MFLPSAIQRSEDLVGIAMPMVPPLASPGVLLAAALAVLAAGGRG